MRSGGRRGGDGSICYQGLGLGSYWLSYGHWGSNHWLSYGHWGSNHWLSHGHWGSSYWGGYGYWRGSNWGFGHNGYNFGGGGNGYGRRGGYAAGFGGRRGGAQVRGRLG
ncbi:hypothetical protein GCM10027422_25030 [Hymenobacter arcticus]